MQLNLKHFRDYLNTYVDIASGFQDSGKIKWYISYTTTSDKEVKLYQESSNQNFADELDNTDVIFEETFDIKKLLKENGYDANQNLLDYKDETNCYGLLIALFVPNSKVNYDPKPELSKVPLFDTSHRNGAGGLNVNSELGYLSKIMKVEATFKCAIEYKNTVRFLHYINKQNK